MNINDVKITADKKPEQTPELNEDGTPKEVIGDEENPTPEKRDVDGDNLEDLDKDEVKDEGADKDDDEEETPEDNPSPEPVIPKVDYKKKFGDSTRRNQIVESQFKELQKVMGDITKQEVPSEEEMRSIDPDWEYRSDFEKNLSIKQIVQERRLNHVLGTVHNITKESEKAEKVIEFIETTPALQGKEEAFYDFATNPKNAGASPEVLLAAFLYEVGNKPSDTTDPQDQAPVKKAPALNRATPRGGNDAKPKGAGQYSDEELKHMRTKDPKKYHQLIRQGKI